MREKTFTKVVMPSMGKRTRVAARILQYSYVLCVSPHSGQAACPVPVAVVFVTSIEASISQGPLQSVNSINCDTDWGWAYANIIMWIKRYSCAPADTAWTIDKWRVDIFGNNNNMGKSRTSEHEVKWTQFGSGLISPRDAEPTRNPREWDVVSLDDGTPIHISDLKCHT